MLGRFGAPTWLTSFCTKKKAASVSQTDVALVVGAGVSGGGDIAKTGNCGLACKSIAGDLNTVVSQLKFKSK